MTALKKNTHHRNGNVCGVYSFTITGKVRMWGIMIEETGTFELLWIDQNHKIYSFEKSGT